jgi:tetratricopeptide (TPR) repeat protein
MAGRLAREALASHQRQDTMIPTMPPEMRELLGRCLQPRPEDRPTTMLEVAADLQVIYERLTGQPYPREIPKAAQRGARTIFRQAYSLSHLGKKEEALAIFEEVIRLDPIDVLSYYNKGNTLKGLDRYKEAIIAYDETIRLDPTDADAYIGKWNALQDLRRYKEAIVAFDEAIRLDPTAILAYYKRRYVPRPRTIQRGNMGLPKSTRAWFSRLNAWVSYKGTRTEAHLSPHQQIPF